MADDRRRGLADVTVGDRVLRATCTPLADEALAEVTAVRTVLVLAGKAGAGTGIEVQDGCHVESPERI